MGKPSPYRPPGIDPSRGVLGRTSLTGLGKSSPSKRRSSVKRGKHRYWAGFDVAGLEIATRVSFPLIEGSIEFSLSPHDSAYS